MKELLEKTIKAWGKWQRSIDAENGDPVARHEYYDLKDEVTHCIGIEAMQTLLDAEDPASEVNRLKATIAKAKKACGESTCSWDDDNKEAHRLGDQLCDTYHILNQTEQENK